MLKNAYFSHLFRHFWPKKFFFKNPASSVFWNHRKLPWCQKSEKTMEPFERNPSGRTGGRKYESKSIVPPKFFGSVQKLHYFQFLRPSNKRFSLISALLNWIYIITLKFLLFLRCKRVRILQWRMCAYLHKQAWHIWMLM